MHKIISRSQLAIVCCLPLCLGSILPTSADAQVVQLPTFRVFSVRTAVSVPDGGRISLGGINRSSRGSISRGIPGLGSVPGAGRLARNRGIGGTTGATNNSVSAQVIVMSEIGDAVLAEGQRQRRRAALQDPNGPPAVQKKADFITQNVGRSRKR